MNKLELINAIAEHTGMTKADAARASDAVLTVILEALRRHEEVRIVGVGTFLVAEKKASTGRDPRTGKEIQIPKSYKVKFRTSKNWKEAVNGVASTDKTDKTAKTTKTTKKAK